MRVPSWLADPRARVLVLLAVLIALAPLLFPSGYYYRVGTLVFLNALTVTGLVILTGYAGQVSLGHAGFFGIGAYACAVGTSHFGLAPGLCVALGAGLAGGLALAVGRPILRLKSHYLAVATLGLGILIAMVLTNEGQWTGGPDGMSAPTLPLRAWLRAWGVPLSPAQAWYALSGLVLLAGAWMALSLRESASGRALRALHDSEVAARVIGIDVARAKGRAFAISAVYASVAGSLMALFNGFVNPAMAGFMHSIELVTMVVLGGAGSVLGGVVGATVLTVLPQTLTVFQEYEMTMLGLIMMVMMIFLRQGVVPGLVGAWTAWRGRRARP
ncbi:branched-chain amino acid ABC transporter permease [Pararhodospirillum oryzae]|nr:branched-chain amino acid ABC transporter permease [Pararhodospirillum oryzae]